MCISGQPERETKSSSKKYGFQEQPFFALQRRKLEDKTRSTLRLAAAIRTTASHKIGILQIIHLHPFSWDSKHYKSVRNRYHCTFFNAARLEENVASQSFATSKPMRR